MAPILNYDLIYENNLDIISFSQMLDDPAQCYKFYWLGAIINLAVNNDRDFTFDEIIDEMICDAWYSVTQYHLRLGPSVMGKSKDLLEGVIKTLVEQTNLSSSATRDEIVAAIRDKDTVIKEYKNGLTRYVPYRLLKPFLDEYGKEYLDKGSTKKLIERIEKNNNETLFPYIIINGVGLKKRIRLNPYWRQFILDNKSVIESWINYNKVRYLQARNPGVPGIVYKLSNNNENTRKLNNARKLWKCAANTGAVAIRDIYSGKLIENVTFDLDHFIPWSYVASDELWNLTPMDRCLNSSKGNKLPEWDKYFYELAEMQFHLYKAVFSFPEIRIYFEKCRKDNLNALWASETLYIEGNSREQFTEILEHNLKPIYESAHLQGYKYWKLQDINSAE